VLQPKMLLRVWDIFFYEGSISLFKITLGMIKSKEKVLLGLENSAQIFNVLSDLPGEITDIKALQLDAERAASSLTYVILDTHRKKHFAYLVAEAANRQDSINNNNSSNNLLQVYRRTRIPIKKTWVNLAYDLGMSFYDSSVFCGTLKGNQRAITMKAKNVLQTEIISELRESILLLARHFDYKGTKADLLPDYSEDSHVQDFENFISVSSTKQRRAKALIDFERHEDDELGFRKNDLITIISQKDEHCWIGELNGLRGWFPAKFVEVLDERSKQYVPAGDDAVTETVTDLVRGKLYHALRRIFDHGLVKSFSGETHPWMFIEEASRREVMKDFQSVYSRLVLCKTYKLDEDGKVLTPEEILYRAVQAINSTHDDVKADMDIKFRSLIAYGLNEQILHLWFEVLCSMDAIAKRWYHPFSYIRSPGWIQIKCELRTLAKFSFNLSIDYEIKGKELASSNMKDDVQDMLVKHHLFSWDL